MRHLSIPGRQVIDAKFIQVIVAATPGHNFHQFCRSTEKIIQLLRAFIYFYTLA
jgi:hypothetical protein